MITEGQCQGVLTTCLDLGCPTPGCKGEVGPRYLDCPPFPEFPGSVRGLNDRN